jgi:CRISPR type III-B/RAMP module RAMP protein Cmr6
MNGLILPQSTAQLIDRVLIAQRHPGLQLDKFSIPGNQMAQKQALDQVCRTSGDSGLLNDLAARRRSLWNTLPGYTAFRATTTSPLALHLARASALENAGICLHPLYGFAYLPGSGLKGMARAYAETIWLPAQTDQRQAWRDIEDVFGWAPHPDRRQQINDPNHPAEVRRQNDTDPRSPEISASCGNVIFHDAWPESWPKLIVDIVNNHHPEYYQAEPNDNAHPPGDWENPVPVYFLAVPPGVTFTFPLTKRHGDVPDRLVNLARDWLLGALCHLGAGAKTATGYGAFQPAEGNVAVPPSPRTTWVGATTREDGVAYEFSAELQLVTPAFLGGPDRNAETTARLTAIKAMLRVWWRAWHGHLTTQQLRQEEAQVFGSIDTGCGLLVLPPANPSRLRLLRRGTNMGSGGSPLGYLGYGPIGYDKQTKANLTQITALDAGQSLSFRLAHRSKDKLQDALKSLWLLGALGGLGSRSRRGWGSVLLLSIVNIDDLPHLASCRTIDEYRDALQRGLKYLTPQDKRRSATELKWTALSKEMRIILSRRTFATWQEAMEDLGTRFQIYRSYDNRAHSPGNPKSNPGPDYHNTKALLTGQKPLPSALPERSGFGLPYAQFYRSLGDRATFTPYWREGNNDIEGRRASPVLCKIVRLADGQFIWQVTFLPAQFLPDGAKVRGTNQRKQTLPNSPFAAPGPFGVVRKPANPQEPANPQDTLIKDFLDWLENTQKTSASGPAGQANLPQSPPSGATGSASPPRGVAAPSRPATDPSPVRVKFLGPHDKLKNAFWVQEEGKKRGLLKYGTPPTPLPAEGSEIEVYPTNNNPNAPEYRWDKPEPSGDQPRGGPGGQQGR